MLYEDRIYGEIDISEPVLVDIINAPSIQRLKHVDQSGYYEPFVSGTSLSRFEHSMGVLILLKKYGASPEEQIAGLIHDVSHSAFSHCIDYVFSDGSGSDQCHQDNVFEAYVQKTEIPTILEKHGIGTSPISHLEKFTLLENELPDICADRIDYSMRSLVIFGIAPKRKIHRILNHLTVADGEWIFEDAEIAFQYAELFRSLNSQHYCSVRAAVMFSAVSEFLKYSMAKEYISKDDLYSTDKELLNKAMSHAPSDEKLRHLFEKMNNRVPYSLSKKNYDAHVQCKSRIIDPNCKYGGVKTRLSLVYPAWKDVVAQESKPKEYFIKFDR